MTTGEMCELGSTEGEKLNVSVEWCPCDPIEVRVS